MTNFIRSLMIVAIASAICASAAPSAQAWTFKVLYSFCAKKNCKDGAAPASLVMDQAGNIFGVSTSGGKHDWGTLFEFSPDPSGGKGQYQSLFSLPYYGEAPLIMDTSGNIFSTTLNGGKYSYGSIFELVRPQPGGKWRYKILHNFCKEGPQFCLDGLFPQSGLTYQGQTNGELYDGTSPLYGSVDNGGTSDSGVLYKLTQAQNGHWHYKVTYNFCQQAGCPDGDRPGGWGLTVDTSGVFWGTTKAGGANDQGVIFEVKGGKWHEQTLYNFCSQENCADGADGKGGLLLDHAGNIFGTTGVGGTCSFYSSGCGVLFKDASTRPGRSYDVLHAFCSQENCVDGLAPLGGLVRDSANTLFGVTVYGGGNNIDYQGIGGGIVYAFDGSFTVLHAFCSEANCADGEYPEGNAIVDSSGDLFGTTVGGGKYGFGALYELLP